MRLTVVRFDTSGGYATPSGRCLTVRYVRRVDDLERPGERLDPVVQWLLQGDPAIRWQVLRDLVGASESEVATERARVEHEGWGARLLGLRAPDGLWANGACFPDTAAFAADTARALAAGEPPPPFPSPDAEPAEAPTDGSGCETGQPWT